MYVSLTAMLGVYPHVTTLSMLYANPFNLSAAFAASPMFTQSRTKNKVRGSSIHELGTAVQMGKNPSGSEQSGTTRAPLLTTRQSWSFPRGHDPGQ